MRTQEWLEQRLNEIWELHFKDIERKNKIIVKFRGKSRYKFGHIRLLKDKSTEIAINSLFKNLEIPQFMIDLTIAHELVHYMHGFQSPHPKMFKYPHQGGIVNKELKKRGFSLMLKQYKNFVKNDWKNTYLKITPPPKRRIKTRKYSLLRFLLSK